jgi:hypothetical protein
MLELNDAFLVFGKNVGPLGKGTQQVVAVTSQGGFVRQEM